MITLSNGEDDDPMSPIPGKPTRSGCAVSVCGVRRPTAEAFGIANGSEIVGDERVGFVAGSVVFHGEAADGEPTISAFIGATDENSAGSDTVPTGADHYRSGTSWSVTGLSRAYAGTAQPCGGDGMRATGNERVGTGAADRRRGTNGRERGTNDSMTRVRLQAGGRKPYLIDREQASRGSGEIEAGMRRMDAKNTGKPYEWIIACRHLAEGGVYYRQACRHYRLADAHLFRLKRDIRRAGRGFVVTAGDFGPHRPHCQRHDGDFQLGRSENQREGRHFRDVRTH